MMFLSLLKRKFTKKQCKTYSPEEAMDEYFGILHQKNEVFFRKFHKVIAISRVYKVGDEYVLEILLVKEGTIPEDQRNFILESVKSDLLIQISAKEGKAFIWKTLIKEVKGSSNN